MNNSDLKKGMATLDGRLQFIEHVRLALNIEHEDNWQENKTPIKIVDQIISKMNITTGPILVLFNIEIVERLIHKYHISSEKIFFFADHPLESQVVEELYNVKTITGNKNIMKKSKLTKKTILNKKMKILLEGSKMKKFEYCISNPPYSNSMDLKIITELFPICKKMIIVHPATWILDMKKKYKLYKDFRKMIKGKVKSLKMFSGNSVFNIHLALPCVITEIDESYSGKISVDYFNDKFEEDSLENITKFGKEWKSIVKPFMEKIKEYISKYDNVWQHNKLEINSEKFHCQFSPFMGNNDKGDKLIRDDFYALIIKNSQKGKGIDYPDLKAKGNLRPTFEFNTEKERDNFFEYCKTDFVRFCLAILKINKHLSSGEMELIPWLDFTQEWTDDKLYKFFKIDKKTQKYINGFLPNYYEIS